VATGAPSSHLGQFPEAGTILAYGSLAGIASVDDETPPERGETSIGFVPHEARSSSADAVDVVVFAVMTFELDGGVLNREPVGQQMLELLALSLRIVQ